MGFVILVLKIEICLAKPLMKIRNINTFVLRSKKEPPMKRGFKCTGRYPTLIPKPEFGNELRLGVIGGKLVCTITRTP